MDDLSKDYLLDQAMASISAFKKASDVVNSKQQDKSKKLTPTQKLAHLTEFINSEYERINREYEDCIQRKNTLV